VSGGAGFIGSHLCGRMLDRGWRVLALDNLVTGVAANLEALSGRDGFDFRRQDVSDSVLVAGGIDAVLHLASPASPADFATMPVEILRAGTRATERLIELALGKGARFLFASSSEVYGDPMVHPQPEAYFGNVNPIGQRSCYDEAKRAGEAFTMAYHRRHGVDTRIVRIFNTYGPRMRRDDGRVIPNFMTQALRGDALTVYGDGSQTRSLCFVDDLVEGILNVLEAGDALPYNVGGQDEVTMLELARLVAEVAGVPSSVEHRPLPEDDPRQRRPDTARARALGWQPLTPLRDGLRRTFDYFRSADGAAA
jgi:dTDP-glucose 4,6-dehydratase